MDEIVWLSTSAAARACGVTPRTLYRLIDDGQLVAYRMGRVIRIKESDVVAFIAQSRIPVGTLGHLYAADTDSEFIDLYVGACEVCGRGYAIAAGHKCRGAR